MTTLDKAVNNRTREIERLVQKNLKKKRKAQNPKAKIIPRDPQEFFADFGGLPHPSLKDEKGQPVIVTKLAPYQYDAWKYSGNLLVVKSNKVGLTTSFLLEDIQSRLFSENAGYDLLIGSQTEEHAFEHIKDLKNLMKGSKKYAKFLDEKKSNERIAYIINPFYPTKETRIIGLGSSERATYSWKKVNKIHLSDVALMNVKGQKNYFGGLYSRLANTNGQIKIETIPNGQTGEVYRIYTAWKQQQLRRQISVTTQISKTFATDDTTLSTTFQVMEIPADQAVQAGLISKEFLDQQRIELSEIEFQKLYGCMFVGSGNQWYKPGWIKIDNYGVQWY